MPDITVRITQTENAEYYGCNVGDTVNVDFERYVAAVTAQEIGNSDIEACKAQAIAQRSLAVSRGALRGLVISDDASVMQAYRASRCDQSKFPYAVQAVRETEGMVLMYKGRIALAHYSGNNGGRTTSSETRWGTAYPYLIEQDDPWDAEDGRAKYGHGVGMSQRGARIAAGKGRTYLEILSFYYPGCEVKEDYGGLLQREVMHLKSEVLLNDKARRVVEIADSKLGDPYVFGAWGDPCTVKIRKQYAGYRPQYKSKIYGACQALSGGKTCEGCKWEGHLCYDCRGFTHYVMKEGAGIDLFGGGCTTQYNTPNNWIKRGKIKDGMPNVVCCVFKYSSENNNYSHTGTHIGDGIIDHCQTIVKRGALSDTSWTHYAVPKGLYTEEELASAGKVVIMTTLKKGSSGEAVMQLQEWLNALGYSVGTVDGRFGGKTYTAVQQFQMDHGLTADGIVGALTWNAIEEAVGKDKPAEDEETVPDTPEDAGDSGTDDEEIAGILATVQEMEKEIASVADLIRELKQRISAINAVG